MAQGADWGVDGGADRRAEIIARYRSILDRRPEDGPIFARLLQEVGGGRALEALIDDYGRLRDQSPDVFGYAMMHGHLLRHADRLDEARAAFETAVTISPDDPLGYRALGSVLRALGDRAAAAEAYEASLAHGASDSARQEALRQLADLAFEARDWGAASGYVERLIAVDPGDTSTRMELADLYVRYERYDEALAQYDGLVAAAGTDTRQRALALVDAGNVLALMGRSDEALQRYRAARRLVDDGYWLTREIDQRVIALYRQDDRLDELIAEFERTWRSPSVAQLALLASLYDETGREQDAIDAYRRALRSAGTSQDVRLALIRLLERRGEMDLVAQEYEALIRVAPTDASYRFRFVEVLRRQGRVDEALRQVDALATRFATTPHVLVDVADAYARLGQDERALATLERLVRIDPTEPNNYVALGEHHFMHGHRSEAERIWRRLLDVIADPAEAHAALGDVFSDHALAEEAIEEFETARALAPDDDVVLRSLAQAYDDGQRPADALAAWTELRARSPQAHTRAEARGAMVRIYGSLGRLEDELTGMRARFDGPPADVEEGYLLAESLESLDRTSEAEGVWNEVLGVVPNDLSALLALERSYTEGGRISDAIDVLQRIAEAHPDRARETYQRLADLSLRVYDDEAAVRFAQLAVDLNPDNAQAQARLGGVLRQMYRLDDAVVAYRQALTIDPRASQTAFELAEIYLALDRPNEADDLYRAIVDGGADDVQILRAGRRSIQLGQASDSLDTLVGLVEPHLFDEDTGETYLKLLVEIVERITIPLASRAAYGAPDEAAAAAARLEQVGRRSLQPLLAALGSDDVNVRRAALRVLVAQGNRNASASIARLLDNPDAALRLEAALAIARMPDARALEPLTRAATGGGAPIDRLAVWTLARVGDPAIDALVALASDRRDDSLRALAVYGLGGASDPARVRATLSDALQRDRSSQIRTAASLAAAQLGDAELVPPLLLRLQHSAAGEAEAAAWALGRMTPTTEIVEALVDGYLHGSPGLSVACARALATVGGPAVDGSAAYDDTLVFVDGTTGFLDVDAYFTGLIATRPSDADLRSECRLAEFGGVISAALARAIAVPGAARMRVLLDLHTQEGSGELGLGALTSSLPPAAAAACGTVVRGWLEPALGSIVAIAEDGTIEQRVAALAALGHFGGANAARVAALACGSREPDLTRAGAVAAAALATGPDEALLAAVQPLLESPDLTTRAAAATALGRLGATARFDQLAGLAEHDPAASVRVAAVVALLQLDAVAAEPVVRALWPTLPPIVRAQAVRTSAARGAASPLLVELASADDDVRVRSAAGLR